MKRTPIIIEESWKEYQGYYGYIYLSKDLKRQKMYIGKKELSYFDTTYFGSGILLQRAYKSRPKDFRCKPIDWAYTKQELNQKEKWWIEFLECLSDVGKPEYDRNYYNILSGGDGGRLTGQSLEKMKKSRLGKCTGKDNPNYKGKAFTDESREKLRQAKLGTHLSEETKAKIGEKSKLFRHTPESKEKLRQAHLGTTLTEETKAKISKNRTGKMVGAQHPLYGTTLTEEQKLNLREKNLYGNSARAKKVYKFDMNMNLVFVYDSRSQVEIDGFTSPKISSICNRNDRSDDTTYHYYGWIFSSNKDYTKKEKLVEVLDKKMKNYEEKRSKQISDSNKGKSHPHTPESKEKLRQAHLGTTLTEETKAKISKNRTGKCTGKDNPNYKGSSKRR